MGKAVMSGAHYRQISLVPMQELVISDRPEFGRKGER